MLDPGVFWARLIMYTMLAFMMGTEYLRMDMYVPPTTSTTTNYIIGLKIDYKTECPFFSFPVLSLFSCPSLLSPPS